MAPKRKPLEEIRNVGEEVVPVAFRKVRSVRPRRRSEEDSEDAAGDCTGIATNTVGDATQQMTGSEVTRRRELEPAATPEANKRQRLPTPIQPGERGQDDYCPGNIMAIELESFMSYDYVKTKTFPRLNLVIGPNGSGKSSLICAMGIGLAGEPKLLGRSSTLGDFVQRGKQWAKIKISIRGHKEGEQHTVARKFDCANTSEWWLDDKPVKQKDVKAFVKEYNIQVGNLMQFLPQDRVSQFAKLNSKELLRETERAVGDPYILQQHEVLISTTEALQSLQLTVAEEESELRQLEAQNKELEGDVAQAEVRETKLEEKQVMLCKQPWLEFSKYQSDLVELAENLQKAEERKEEQTSSQEAENAPLRVLKDKHSQIVKEQKLKEKALNDLDQLLQSANSKDEELVRSIRLKHNEIEHGRQEAENLATARVRAARALAEAEADLASTPLPPRPVAEMEKHSKNINSFRQRCQEKQMDVRAIQGTVLSKQTEIDALSQRVKDMESLSFRRIKGLHDEGVYRAWNRVQSQKHRFKGRVYGPIAAEITCRDPAIVAPLEQHVPNWLWKSFVTTCPEDRDLLTGEIKANIVCVDGNTQPPPADRITHQMQMLGIQTTLAESFDAPMPVKAALSVQAMVHKSFYGTATAEDNFDAMYGVGIMDLYTPRSHLRVTQSRYGSRTVSKNVDTVRGARFLTAESGHDGELKELKSKIEQLQEEISKLKENVALVEQEICDLQRRGAETERERADVTARYTERKNEHLKKASTVEQRRRALQSLLGVEDAAKAEERLRKEIAKYNDERFTQILKTQEYTVQKGRVQMELAVVVSVEAEAYAEVQIVESRIKRSERAALEVDNEYKTAKRAHDRALVKLKEAKVKAMGIYDLQNAPDRDEMKLKWEELPSTIEQLQEAIDEKQAEADEHLCCNPMVVREYKERQAKIEVAAAQLETDTAKLLALSNEIADLKASWLPRLRDLVGRISESFSRNFSEMAVAGEVVLDEKDMAFEDYGIQVLVQFRETGQLQPLSETHQSGGERSVATIIYLVSLQNLTQCPFRVVDEINQGMDPINERKMFQQLVRAASQPNTAQCFLITPKLLPCLHYGECSTILSIMNGPWVSGAVGGAFKEGDSLGAALRRICGEAP